MASAILRNELLTTIFDTDKPVSKVEIQEVSMVAGTKAPLHLHPCPTFGIVKDGVITFQIEGEPARKLKSGEIFYEPQGVRVARFDNDTDKPATFVVFYLLAKEEKETVRVLKE